MSEHETTATDLVTSDGDTPLTDEAFIRCFQSMVPDNVADSFDPVQLKAIAMVFGTRRWRRHAFDRRLVFALFRRNCYFFALAGGERRSAKRRLSDRLLHSVATFGNAAFALVFSPPCCSRCLPCSMC